MEDKKRSFDVIDNAFNRGMFLRFQNGYRISIQFSGMNYCDSGETTCEIAVFNSDDDFVNLLGYDDVIGWLSSDTVADVISIVKDAKDEASMIKKIQEAVKG